MADADSGSRDSQRPAGNTGRPSVRAFTTTLLLFGVTYFGSLLAAEVSTAVFLKATGVLPTGVEHLFLEPCACVVFLVPWYLIAGPGREPSPRWRASGIRALHAASTPILVVAALTGWIVGCLIISANAFLPAAVADLFQVVALATGPLVGILALVWRVHRAADPEADSYDDQQCDIKVGTTHLVELESLAATEAFGRRLGGLLFPNAVIALVGPLGAGKTHLTRAIAEGLGIANSAAVTSPTFTLVHEYPARLPIFHFDAYRLSGAEEFLDLGVGEYYEAGGVCLIEWADRVEAALPVERLTILLRPMGADRREATMIPIGEAYTQLARALDRPGPQVA